jgi:plastocyanin
MSFLPLPRVLLVLLLAMGGLFSAGTVAQDDPDGVVVATGLTNPRGALSVGDLLFVALAGSGGDVAGDDGWLGGQTGAVALIDDQGCAAGIVTGLASTVNEQGVALGASDVAILDNQLYAVVDGGGASFGNPDQPSGVYLLLADGTFLLVAELPSVTSTEPNLADALPAASFGMVADGTNNVLWVVDSRSGSVVTVAPDGTTTAIADLAGDFPTRPVLDPNGGIFVGTLSSTPFVDGSSSVLRVGLDGEVTEVWTDLTVVVDVAVDDGGTLYALELATGHAADATAPNPDSGRLVQQTGDATSEVIAENLQAPIALDLGTDDTSFYVSMPGTGASDGSGVIVQFGAPGEATPAGQCAPLPETLGGSESGTDPAQTPEASQSPVPTATPEPTPEVTIADFTFRPGTLEIVAGEQVIFSNDDAVAHTVTADDGSFDTGNIAPGHSATITFDTPGTYTFGCAYHSAMPLGTIVVTAPPVASPAASPIASPAATPRS